MVTRVNTHMQPVQLDFEKDVVPLTPKGNATERHLCEAYEREAALVFPDAAQRAAYWKEKLGDSPPAGAKLQNLIRAMTMKKGGVGYVHPGKGSFPLMADMNRFVLESGAIPTLAWLDGTTDGEKCIEDFFQIGMASGAAELQPLVPVFLRGAHIVYAHSVLQRQAGLGYLSAWAKKTFPTVAAKSGFFEKLGRELQPATEDRLHGLTAETTPAQILTMIL